jgi:hypothetical protein
MARYDLSKYAPVAQRLAMLEKDFPDYRLETQDYSTVEDRAKNVWRVKATLYLTKEDQIDGVPKATGHAFEIDSPSGQGPNATSALENCETSAVGRCLALASAKYSGNKDDAAKSLASREEMEKVARGPVKPEPVAVPDDFLTRVDACVSVKELQSLWDEAVEAGFSDTVKKVVADRKAKL